MKTYITLIVLILSTNLIAQKWLDNSCKDFKEDVILIDYETSKERNVINILINQSDEVIINEEEKPNLVSEIPFKEFILDFITNPSKDKLKAENPNKVFIKLYGYNKKSEKLEKLNLYIKEVYLYIWDNYAMEKYNSSYVELNCKKRQRVYDAYPLRLITEALPQKKTSKNTRPKGIGVPPFGGDTKQ